MKTKLNSKSQPNKKKGNTSLSTSKAITKCNKLLDSSTLRSVLLLVVSIVLILILVWVYKYYTSTENFETQEPIDLIDRLKNNIYENRSVWSNYLYNQQPNKNENPLTFWKVSRDDNTYKYIGNAISTTVNSITGQYTPTKESTMLVQGDTKAPESSRLVFELPHNLITTNLFVKKEKNMSVYKNIADIKDIDFRLGKLKNVYDILLLARDKFDKDLLRVVDTEMNNIQFKTYLYNIDNFFKNPTSVLTSNFNNRVRSLNGNYNCIRFPVGFKVVFTFTNGFRLTLDPDVSKIIDSSGTKFNKLNYNNTHMQRDGTMFKYVDQFGIIEDNGINRDNPKLVDNRTTKIGKSRSENIKFSFNYMVRKSISNKHDPGYSGRGKNTLHDYLVALYKDNERENVISGYDGDYNEFKHVYISKPHESDTGDIFIKSNVDDGYNFIKYNDPNNNNVYYNDKAKDKAILNSTSVYNVTSINKSSKKSTPTTTTAINTTTASSFTNIEQFTNNTNLDSKLIVNSKLHVKPDYINFSINIGYIFNDINTELNNLLIDNNYEWLSDMRAYLNKLSSKNTNSSTAIDRWINNILSTTISDDVTFNGINVIQIKYPFCFIDYTFKYPQFSRSWKRKNWGTKEIPIEKAYAARDGSRRNVTELMWKTGDIGGLTQLDFDGYIPTHNSSEIGGSLLQNVEISSNFSKEGFPIFVNINNYVKNNIGKIDDLLTIISEMSNNLNNLKAQMQANSFKHYPMKIYRPVAPKYYKTVGDVIMALDSYSSDTDYNQFINEPILAEIACVPEQCVREIREWLPIDKVYEYQEGNKYLAIYKNPYLQSFRAVTKPGVLPSGKVEKIVACVDRCELVDDLIQADKCAQTFYKAHKAVNDTYNLDPDNILHERKSNIYKNKIVDRQNRIDTLKEVARRLQVQDDKANMINKAHNRHKLQNLVDTQKANMFKLVDNLEQGKNRIDINVKFDYDIASGTLNDLCKSSKLPPAVCDKLNNILDNSARRALKLTGDERTQFDRQTLDALLRNCPTPDMENLFKRSLVESNCGCYFSDSELESA
jgi:hypothetical protein